MLFSGNPTPENLEYLDLLSTRKTSNHIVPDAVAEFQGRAIFYLVDGNGHNGTNKRIAQLQTLLAKRGEHACLGITKPGFLDVHPGCRLPKADVAECVRVEAALIGIANLETSSLSLEYPNHSALYTTVY